MISSALHCFFLSSLSTVAADSFTSKLFDIYEKAREQGTSQVSAQSPTSGIQLPCVCPGFEISSHYPNTFSKRLNMFEKFELIHVSPELREKTDDVHAN